MPFAWLFVIKLKKTPISFKFGLIYQTNLK